MIFRSLALGVALTTLASQALGEVTPLNAPVATSKFYTQSSTKIVWKSEANFSALLQALDGLSAHGLNPNDYHLDALKSSTIADEKRDQLATDAWFSAAAHMLYGKLNPTSVEPDWTAARREADLPAALLAALNAGTVASSLEQFKPKQPSYAALKKELAVLRADAEKPQTLIPTGDTLKPNMSNARVGLLKIRLVELGYLTAASDGLLMDSATTEAVKAFQLSTDLDDDGAVGPATLAALNRGTAGKRNQLRVNMERWRWLPDDLGTRHLRANIAGFNVTAWNEGVLESTHLTIVGRTYRKTPVFSDIVEYIVLNPWWETPNSLATRDKLPTFRKDPSSVERLGFQILDRQGQPVPSASIDWNSVSPQNFPYRIRQRPGDLNALGQVKIMFPNVHNVYLHDTPTRGLFAQRQRAFSSGCLRTENPLDLSAWLMNSPDWDRARIDSVVATAKETRVNLPKPVPVHILYFTTVSEGEFGVRYLDDIYDRDAKVLSGLNAKPRTF
jgi:murein L,D-transpeptidase YcbB/YkuD